MRTPARILVVDDNPTNVDILATRLESEGYEIITAHDGEEALAAARSQLPDLILLDVMMPKVDGFQVCRELKADTTLPFMPIILVTAKTDSKDVVAGLESGGDEYLAKPVDHAALVARVRSILRTKALHDQVEEQSAKLAEWNKELENRVAEQLREIEQVSRLKRFLSPQVAELIVAQGDEQLLDSHRREVTIVFCDLRDFTAFSETAEPEAVMDVLRGYHEAVGVEAHAFEGTIEHFAGDGVMVIFNDPLPTPAHPGRAVRMGVAIREKVQALAETWRHQGHKLGIGVGISQGFATLGRIGFQERFDYAAIGTVVNFASRLCDVAEDGQVLISDPVLAALGGIAKTEPLVDLTFKGLSNPVSAHNVVKLNS